MTSRSSLNRFSRNVRPILIGICLSLMQSKLANSDGTLHFRHQYAAACFPRPSHCDSEGHATSKSVWLPVHHILTYHEVKKGWAYNATSQNATTRRKAKGRLRNFEEFCYQNEVLPLTRNACNVAAAIYGERRRQGLNYRAGLDLLIAGIALDGDYTIVTENRADFTNISSLRVENWLL